MTQDDADTPVSEDADTPVSEKAREMEKFRAALERKKAAQHRSQDGSAAISSVQGSETAGPSQRRFQRKSGSS